GTVRSRWLEARVPPLRLERRPEAAGPSPSPSSSATASETRGTTGQSPSTDMERRGRCRSLAPSSCSYRHRQVAAGSGAGDRLRREDRDLGLFREHHAEHLLEGEKVDARSPTVKVVAGASPLAGIEIDMVRVVVAAERERESVDGDSIE